MITFVAILPLLFLFLLMVVFEKPAYISAPITLFVTSFAALIYWEMDLVWFEASLVRAGLLTMELMIIIVGVLLMTYVVKKGGIFTYLKFHVFRLSKDVRVQVILISWFLVCFMEGIAGFGTPSMIAGPLLVALGFSPFAAVTTTLIGDAVAVSFGAAGVPMLIGIGEGITPDQVLLLGENFLRQTYMVTALFQMVLGVFIPLIILIILNIIYERSVKKAFAAAPFAFVSGISFTIPYAILAYLLGPEFPAILGSLIGLGLVIWFTKKRWFLPAHEWDFTEKDRQIKQEMIDKPEVKHIWKAILPYGIVIFLLFLTRLNIAGMGDFFKMIKISVIDLFGTSVQYTFYPFYSPGFFFLLAAVTAFFFFRFSHHAALEIMETVSNKSLKIFVSLISVLGIVQILIYSGNNFKGLPSFLGQIIHLMVNTGGLWPIFSPIIGLFGSFVAGSSTVSNLMFSSVQVETALAIGMVPILGLVLQAIGSAAGNMISIHNIISASAVVHLEHHREGKVIRYNIIPALGYTLAAGIFAYIFTILS